MHELLERTLETTILLILWSNATTAAESRFLSSSSSGERSSAVAIRQNVVFDQFWTKRNKPIVAHPTLTSTALTEGFGKPVRGRSIDQARSYYNVPAAPFVPAFDPISVLASLAFLAFLLQSFAALFDRTRSIIPTIISSRRASSQYDEHFADVESKVLRALDEYASLSNDLLDKEKESEKTS